MMQYISHICALAHCSASVSVSAWHLWFGTGRNWRIETRAEVSGDENSYFLNALWSPFFSWGCCTCSFLHKLPLQTAGSNSHVEWINVPGSAFQSGCLKAEYIMLCMYSTSRYTCIWLARVQAQHLVSASPELESTSAEQGCTNLQLLTIITTKMWEDCTKAGGRCGHFPAMQRQVWITSFQRLSVGVILWRKQRVMWQFESCY